MKYLMTFQVDEEQEYAKLTLVESDGDNSVVLTDEGKGDDVAREFIKEFKQNFYKLKAEIEKENKNEM